MKSPPVPVAIAQALSRYPSAVRAQLLEVRKAIFTAAAETDGVGPLTETLKWGEPAYLTEASRSGSTIRLGVPKAAVGKCAVLFNCRTSLVPSFREQFAGEFEFEGDRALIIPADRPLPRALALCLRAALTYHRRRA